MIDNNNNVSKSKDKTILKCVFMTLDISKSDNSKYICEYIVHLNNIVNNMSPINISYDLSYSPLEDNSFQINVMKKTVF